MLLGIIAFLALGPHAVSISAAQVETTGRTVTLGDISYFVPPSPVSILRNPVVKIPLGIAEFILFSVIRTSKAIFDQAALQDTVNSWSVLDDVWSQLFLTGVYLSFNGTGPSASCSLVAAQKKFGIAFVLHDTHYPLGVSLTKTLPSGPYFLEPATGHIFEALRLFNDEQQSFLYGTIPNGSGGFEILNARISGAATETISVLSRLYFTRTATKPLEGMRLAVKDIYDVKGLHTGCGNRAFWQLYPPKEATAPAIQRLLDGGMVLVGKTKSSQFANGETATDDWDGSSSSTGSGNSIAAYPWLDFAVGSDTGGSMRGPAGANGMFGNRPSHGAVGLDDVMPLSPELDTAGIFSRDAQQWAAAGHWWYQNFTSFSQFPNKILLPLDFWGSLNDPTPGSSARGFLNTTRTEFSLSGARNATKPVNVPAPSLQTLLTTTYADLITLYQIALVADPFIADYGAANGGRVPFIDPAPLARWGYGRGLPAGRKEEALVNKTIFMDWFQSEVVKTNATTYSDSIFLYPRSSGATNYRNRYLSPPSAPLGFSAGRISVHAEVPDMFVPIGEVAYTSTITGQIEHLPVTISFIAAKGCDLILFNLFAALQDANVIRPVATGPRVFPS